MNARQIIEAETRRTPTIPQKAQALNRNAFWLDPSGNFYALSGRQHCHWANDYLQNDLGTDDGTGELTLYRLGWKRGVITYAPGKVYTNGSGSYTRAQRSALEDLGMHRDMRVVDVSARPYTIFSPAVLGTSH